MNSGKNFCYLEKLGQEMKNKGLFFRYGHSNQQKWGSIGAIVENFSAISDRTLSFFKITVFFSVKPPSHRTADCHSLIDSLDIPLTSLLFYLRQCPWLRFFLQSLVQF